MKCQQKINAEIQSFECSCYFQRVKYDPRKAFTPNISLLVTFMCCLLLGALCRKNNLKAITFQSGANMIYTGKNISFVLLSQLLIHLSVSLQITIKLAISCKLAISYSTMRFTKRIVRVFGKHSWEAFAAELQSYSLLLY